MLSGIFTLDQSQAEHHLALERGLQARGRAAGKGQLLRRGGPQMALAVAGGATVWQTGLRLSRLAGILGSQCLHASHYSMEARPVADVGMILSMQERQCLCIQDDGTTASYYVCTQNDAAMGEAYLRGASYGGNDSPTAAGMPPMFC